MYPCIVIYYDETLKYKEFADSSDAQEFRDELIDQKIEVRILWLETKITEI